MIFKAWETGAKYVRTDVGVSQCFPVVWFILFELLFWSVFASFLSCTFTDWNYMSPFCSPFQSGNVLLWQCAQKAVWCGCCWIAVLLEYLNIKLEYFSNFLYDWGEVEVAVTLLSFREWNIFFIAIFTKIYACEGFFNVFCTVHFNIIIQYKPTQCTFSVLIF